MKKTILIGAAALLVGCASLQPGADPLVVRAEQTEAIAKSAFDTVLNFDNSNRGFWATNSPAYHSFCEWLRQPQTVEATNTLPRAAAMLISLDDIKLAYKISTVSSNALIEAITTVSAAAGQAQAWITISTSTH